MYNALFSDEMEEYLPDVCAHSEVFISNMNKKIEFCFILYDTTEEYASSNMAYGIVNVKQDGEFVSFCEFTIKIEKISIEEDMKKDIGKLSVIFTFVYVKIIRKM